MNTVDASSLARQRCADVAHATRHAARRLLLLVSRLAGYYGADRCPLLLLGTPWTGMPAKGAQTSAARPDGTPTLA